MGLLNKLLDFLGMSGKYVIDSPESAHAKSVNEGFASPLAGYMKQPTPTPTRQPTPIPTPTLNPKTPNRYEDLIRGSAQQYGLPAHQLSNLLSRESMGFNPGVISGNIRSPVGAMGIAQFMPDTADWWAKTHGQFDPLVPEQAVPAAAHYLSYLNNQFGSLPASYAAYNWGEGNVRGALGRNKDDFLKAYGMMPRETRDYIPAVMAQDWPY